METSILKTLGLIAGIGGLSLGVLLIVLRGIIRKRIFPKFKNEKLAYRLLRLIVIVVWTVAIIGIAAWVITTLSAKPAEGNIAVTNNQYSGSFQCAPGGVILNQYLKIYGKPLKDKILKEEIQRGMNLIKAGIYEEALPIFQKIAEQLKVPAACNNLGGIYAVLNNKAKAREQFVKAAEKDPGFQPVQHNLGLLMLSQGKTEEALAHFDKAPNLKQHREKSTKKAVTFTTSQGEKIEARTYEKEPNNKMPELDNQIPLGKWIYGRISGPDKDYFKIITPGTCRDIIKVQLKNTSTSLLPNIILYNEDKISLKNIGQNSHNVTPGQNLECSFPSSPGKVFFVLIRSHEPAGGPYLLKITPMKAYDRYEENKDIANARAISFGKTIDANIMDTADEDYYYIHTSAHKISVVISVENKSTTLKPQIDIYDKKKHKIGRSLPDPDNVTQGEDMEYSFVANPDSRYNIRIKAQSGSGPYRLTVSEKSVAQT